MQSLFCPLRLEREQLIGVVRRTLDSNRKCHSRPFFARLQILASRIVLFIQFYFTPSLLNFLIFILLFTRLQIISLDCFAYPNSFYSASNKLVGLFCLSLFFFFIFVLPFARLQISSPDFFAYPN